MKIRALPTKLLVTDIERGESLSQGGIVLLDDNATKEGIYARWMQVYSKGREVTDDIQEGDWIFVEHGRWTRAMRIRMDDNSELELWGIDLDSVLLVSSERPNSERALK
jgi:co-chaperonin GroES (HSP10)